MSFTSPLSGVLPPRLLLHGESRIPSFFGGRRVQGVLHLSPLLVSAPSAPSGRARGCIPSPWMRPKRLRLHRWSVPTLKLQWRSRIRRRPPAMPSRVSRVGKRCAPQARACHRLKKALIFRTNAEFRATRQRYVDGHEFNLVTQCMVKQDAAGNVLRRKFRVTAVDSWERP